MTGITHVAPDSPAEDIVGHLERDAAVVVDDAMGSTTLDLLRSELTPFLETTGDGTDEFGGFRTKRIGALIARSTACRDLALHPLVTDVAGRYLSPFSDGFQLHFTQAVSIGPGESAQVLHRDRGVWGGRLPRRIETQLSTIWAMTDFTEENGATRIVPGSHTWDKDRVPSDDEILAAEMAAGSVLLYTGTVLHGGGPNASATARVGVLLHYTLSWLRQEENQYLSCPPEIARTLRPELRDLLGYSKGGYVLGFYSDPVGPGEDGAELASPERLFTGPSGATSGERLSAAELVERTT